MIHSLSISCFFNFNDNTSILDFGTGGGLPGIPLAICFPNVKFHLVDSIKKKTGVVNKIIKDLNLNNVEVTWANVKNINKNYDFMVKALQTISQNSTITVINPPKNIKEFNCVYTETQDQTLSVISENEIYLHASEHETVGLPLYEAQNLGLKLVIPKRPYTNYFRSENVFTYELNNPQSALISIEEAKNFNIKNSPALIYNENWSKILEYI